MTAEAYFDQLFGKKDLGFLRKFSGFEFVTKRVLGGWRCLRIKPY